MEPLAERVRLAISDDLELATSPSRLGARVGMDRNGGTALIHELRRHAAWIRVVDPWRGPWRTGVREHATSAPPGQPVGGGRRVRHRNALRDAPGSATPENAPAHLQGPMEACPLIVPVDVGWGEGEAGLARRLRESLYRIGRSVDEHSPVATARLARLLHAAAATQKRLRALGTA